MTNSKLSKRKLTMEEAANLREEYRNTLVSQSALALQYGVSTTTVQRILKGKTYKEVGPENQAVEILDAIRKQLSTIIQRLDG